VTEPRPATRPESKLTVVDADATFPRVTLADPADSRYVHLAASVDDPFLPFLPVYLFDSDEKRALLGACTRLCDELAEVDGVVEATVFEALLRPPGHGAHGERTDEDVPVADFDVAVLIEVADDAALRRLEADETYLELESTMEGAARSVHRLTGTNARRIGPVDHDSDGVFLFNYFVAGDVERTLQVWEYTAGWFQSETGLDNSTLIVPAEPDRSAYALLNHCRWDGLRDVLPALLVQRTFRTYVLANFEANGVVPMPILFRLA
jgi:hypothetical protein